MLVVTMHLKDHYFSQKLELRVAFREFVACIGIGCVIGSLSSMGKDVDHILESVRKRIIDRWHDALTSEMVPDALKPVTDLTFAAAMLPGGKHSGFCMLLFFRVLPSRTLAISPATFLSYKPHSSKNSPWLRCQLD